MEKKRQSVDFKDIWNIQTSMDVESDKWDELFHNWNNPKECEGKKRITGCVICEALEKNGKVTRKSDGKVFTMEGEVFDEKS